MSQHHYHCPASPMPAAPVPLPLGQSQSGYIIPCGSGILPSESASQPIRSSALPAGSATPYTTTTGYIVLLFSLMKYRLFLSTIPSKKILENLEWFDIQLFSLIHLYTLTHI